jgi:tetratricopeptide (TPR) repeat protein
MFKCEKCNNICYPEDKYCGKCGAKLTWKTKSIYVGGMAERDIKSTKVSLDARYVLYQLGMVYYRKGKLDDAISTWQKLLEFDPQNEKAKSMLERAVLEKEILK